MTTAIPPEIIEINTRLPPEELLPPRLLATLYILFSLRNSKTNIARTSMKYLEKATQSLSPFRQKFSPEHLQERGLLIILENTDQRIRKYDRINAYDLSPAINKMVLRRSASEREKNKILKKIKSRIPKIIGSQKSYTKFNLEAHLKTSDETCAITVLVRPGLVEMTIPFDAILKNPQSQLEIAEKTLIFISKMEDVENISVTIPENTDQDKTLLLAIADCINQIEAKNIERQRNKGLLTWDLLIGETHTKIHMKKYTLKKTWHVDVKIEAGSPD